MALTTIGAGIDLADTLLKTFAPSITQVQKESLLDAYKKRSAEINAAVASAAVAPEGRPVPALHDVCDSLCVAAGIPSGDLGANVSVSLDRLLALFTIANAYVLLCEQNAGEVKPS